MYSVIIDFNFQIWILVVNIDDVYFCFSLYT